MLDGGRRWRRRRRRIIKCSRERSLEEDDGDGVLEIISEVEQER